MTSMSKAPRVLPLILALGVSMLSACGGGSGPAATTTAGNSTNSSAIQSGIPTFQVASSDEITPHFHMAPVQLDEPANIDSAQNPHASARMPVHEQAIPAEFRGMDTRLLTPEGLAVRHRQHLN